MTGGSCSGRGCSDDAGARVCYSRSNTTKTHWSSPPQRLAALSCPHPGSERQSMEYGSGHKRSKRQRLLREGQALFPSAQLRPPPPESGRGSAAPRLDNTAAFISPADCMSGDTGHEPPSRRLYEPLPLPHRILGCPSASVRHGAKMSGPHRSWCRRPYLVRNFNTAVTSLQMDVSFPDYSKSPAEIQKEHCARQAKRRRLANGTFRGNGGIDLPPDSPGHLDRLLRVDIGMILHKKSARVKFSVQSDTPAQGASSRARCRVSIYHIDGGHPRLLHCDSQICNVASSDNPAGPERMARVSLPQPFTVAAEKILIERDGTMDFADTYQLAIEVETVGDANWPPLKLSMPADASDGPDLDDVAREWLFVTKIWDLYAQSQQPRLPLMLWNKKSRYFDRESNFVADVILEWASLSGRLAHTRPEKDALEDGVRPLPIAEVDPDEEDIRPAIGPLTNGINGHAATSGDTTPNGLVNGVNGIPGGDKDEDEAELAPARTLRAREKQPQYNLRFLIDQAHGRLRRSRSTQSDKEDRQSDEDRPAGEDGLTYNLPAEQLAVSGFVCCVCGAATQSMLQLRAHFMCHPTYSFTMEQPNARGGNVVNISYLRGTSWSLRPAVYQLGRTTRPLDLKKLVEGDDSWVTDRYGPDNGKVSGHQIPRVVMVCSFLVTVFPSLVQLPDNHQPVAARGRHFDDSSLFCRNQSSPRNRGNFTHRTRTRCSSTRSARRG